jgi:D-alanyl-lipoteichoic acid acyltransferase DltB (MBOAT superfamily)|tara:strand:- start:1578 stop:2876 length:1299 start_codon:yes stop_codon:yes gene_type:complete
MAIGANLGLLGYFKYMNFFIESIEHFFPLGLSTLNLALPLGISFFTFQQIGYQVDIYKGLTKPAPFFKYALFVTFFPQLIAGPIVHYTRFLPQIGSISVNAQSLAAGITLFVLGLSKKVLIADKLAPLVNYYYANIGQDQFDVGILDMWFVVLAYGFQLYFDFSGYADMALGIGLCFSIVLPINFFSPYKATSLTEFWRCWHITLSDFLREYVYIPLGGNRSIHAKQFRNIVLTMLLGGLWHGAGWNFILWGGISGLIMGAEKLCSQNLMRPFWFSRALRKAVTFIIITLLWVLFRANSIDDALKIYSSLLGNTEAIVGSALYESLLYGTVENKIIEISALLISSVQIQMLLFWVGFLSACGFIIFLLPNTAQLFKEQLKIMEYNPKLAKKKNVFDKLVWKPNIFWMIFTAFLMLSVTVFMKRQVEFLYFQF